MQLITAIGIIIFWVIFFTIGFKNPNYPEFYSKFEYSFLLPDTFLVIVLILAYINKLNYRWQKFTHIAAGAMIFLGLCDFSFNILNDMYTVGIYGMLYALINIWCIVFGFVQIKVSNKSDRRSIF